MRLTLILALSFLTVSCAGRRAPVPPAALQATPDFLDLRPGVRLGVEKAYYEGGGPGRGLNGFLGTQIATFGVQADGALRFLGQETKPFRQGPGSQLPAEQLLPVTMRGKRHYRFFYAVAFARSSRPSASVLLGAKSVKELEDFSARLKTSPEQVCRPQSATCTVFPQGSTVSISMEIVVNGVARVVLWGSVLGSVTGGRTDASLERIASGRLQSATLADEPLRTPLLPGDRVSF